MAVQFLLFFLIFFAYFGIFKEGQVVNNQFLTFVSIFIGVSILKFVTFFFLFWYRGLGRNYSNVVVIGMDDTTKKIIKLFGEKANLGYRYYGFFSDQPYKDKRQLGKFDDSFDYILNHGIDEVYCTLSKVSESQVKELTKFTNKHSLILKLIPE